MKRLERAGALVFDLVTVAVLLGVSFFLVFPFLTVLCGAVAWFQEPSETRELSVLFHAIRDRWKRTLPFGTVIFLGSLIAALDITYFRQYAFPGSNVILALSWILIIVAFVTVVSAPTLLNRMTVTLPQLIYDGIIVAAASPLDFILAAALHAGLVYVAVTVPMLAFPLSVPVFWIASRFTLHAFQKLEPTQPSHKTGGINE
jgi:uncharacterized membrane protein YesL